MRRRLGAYIDEANRSLLDEHVSLTIDERLARSVALWEWSRGYARPYPRENHDEPAKFYAKARDRGLIRA
jgi:hypothetical protein